MKDTVLAIDFNNVVFASFYGKPLTNSRGMNVNVILSFFNKLKIMKDIIQPQYIVFASDLSREKTFRRRLYPAYKAQRKPMDENLRDQMRYIGNLVALLGYHTLNDESYEADDILGMISRYCNDNDMDCVIVSSDRDLYQLINEHTFIMSPRADKVLDLQYMKDTYKLTPDQWIEYKVLQGDKSDNIPGIVGIGPKTALQLLQDFDTIENIYKNIDIIRPATKEALMLGKDSIELTKKLVTIITDYHLLGIDINKLIRKEPFPDEIFRLLKHLETYSLFNVMRYSLLPDRPTVE